MLKMELRTRIPREGTHVRTFLEGWAQAGRLRFTEAARMYASRPSGRSPSMRHVGLTLTRYLKRFGQRTRDPHTNRSVGWTVRPAVVAALVEGRDMVIEHVDVFPVDV